MAIRKDTNYLESLLKKSDRNQNILGLAIFIGITIIIVAIITFYKIEIKNESLLFAVLIFGIYLVFSGRISQLKFMDFEVQIREAEGKTPKITNASNVELQMDEIKSRNEIDKGGTDKIKEIIIPKLINDAKTYTSQIYVLQEYEINLTQGTKKIGMTFKLY